jgi:hypothetical protein
VPAPLLPAVLAPLLPAVLAPPLPAVLVPPLLVVLAPPLLVVLAPPLLVVLAPPLPLGLPAIDGGLPAAACGPPAEGLAPPVLGAPPAEGLAPPVEPLVSGPFDVLGSFLDEHEAAPSASRPVPSVKRNATDLEVMGNAPRASRAHLTRDREGPRPPRGWCAMALEGP